MQHVILEVCGGKLGGTKRALAPGQSVKVGRRAPADLVVADDAMSAPHFEVAWDGAACTVRDLKSAKGTLVGGEVVARAALANGAWIRAGATDFLVSFEGATPPSYDFDASMLAAEDGQVSAQEAAWLRKNRGPELAKRAARDARAEAARQALSREPGKLYAVLDSARSPRIRTLLRESIEPCQSLYDGVEGEALAHVAPYLVEIDRRSDLLGRLLAEGVGASLGKFLHVRPPVPRRAPPPPALPRRRGRRHARDASISASTILWSSARSSSRRRRTSASSSSGPCARSSSRARRASSRGSTRRPRRPADVRHEARAAEQDRRACVRRQIAPASSSCGWNALKFVYRLDEDELRRRVVHCIARAREHGFTWESSISIFVLHMISIHPRFDEQPAIAFVLGDASIPIEERLPALLSRPDAAWTDAAATGEVDAYWAAVRAAEGAQS